jgi:purine nucleosidase
VIPVLLDTDIGSDIDDALALAYLLRQPQCELVGITTATGDTAKRAALAAWLCQEAERPDVPVRAGLRGPLLTGPGQAEVPQYAAFTGTTADRCPNTGSCAIEFMREAIHSRPGEITLLAIGPLTNVAALFASDPAIPGLLKQVVLMCGTYGHTYAGRLCHTEWNAHCDPVAAAVVFQHAAAGTLV